MPTDINASTDANAEQVRQLMPDASLLRDALAEKLAEFQEKAQTNHLQSPVRNMALHVSSLLQNGKVDFAALSDLIQLLNVNAIRYRGDKLNRYVGGSSGPENEAALRTLFENLSLGDDGNPLAFDAFRERVEREALGLVITAHPTFAIGQELAGHLAGLACAGDGADNSAIIEKITATRHGTPGAISLDDEMEFALMATTNIRGALSRIYGILFAVAQDRYPDDWHKLTPKMLTVATWVGYDLDGRSDIKWPNTLMRRMVVERLGLDGYLDRLDGVDALSDVCDQLRQTRSSLDADIERLAAAPETADEVGAFSRALVDSMETRLTGLADIIDRLTHEIETNRDGDAVSAANIAVVRAEMANFGLALAHSHVRINSSQITNAVRHDIELTSEPEDPANKRRYQREISELLDTVEPMTVNFGSVMRERATAKRLVMLVAQFLKFVDGGEPVRFLIAECNTSFTVLAALYLARQFGIDERIDISPLFETAEALERGHEIIAELLDNPHYVAYVKARGRLCIQTGFSDAGRYIGQIPASLAIERVRIKLARVLSKRDLGDIELVIFDTHGESIGRGAHPLSFADRLDMTYPPEARAAFSKAGIRVKQELSFQGGDGYVYFANPELAFATLRRLLEHALDKNDPDRPADPFYEDRDYSLDFFLSVKAFNERLIDNPDYPVTLDLFGANLLYPTGSRNMKRQHEDGGQTELEHPSQVRAIPHNAILQQLGYLSNSISGLGRAIARDQERFEEVVEKSDRLQRFMTLAVHARKLSNLDALHGYISLFDPTIWIRRSTVEGNPERVEQMRHLSHILRNSSRHEKMNRVYRIFLNDTVYLDQALSALQKRDLLPAQLNSCEPDLTLLHGIRIALIHELFLLFARLPKFTNMERSSDEVMNELLHLNVEHAIGILRRGFPVSETVPDPEAFGEHATYRTDAEQGYEREHRELFDPIEELYDMLRRAGLGITHIMGAVG